MPVSLQCHRAKICVFKQSQWAGKKISTPIFDVSFFVYIFGLLFSILRPPMLEISVILSFVVSSLFIVVIVAGPVCFCALVMLLHIQDAFHFLLDSIVVNKPGRRSRKRFIIFFELSLFSIILSSVAILLLTSSGTVEINPGPSLCKINFATWNLNSLLTRDGSKKDVIEGLDACYSFDIFGICESFLTNNVDENDLKINGFSDVPFRADCTYSTHPRGGVCLYFKENIPIIQRCDLELIDETVVAEIKLKNKNIFYVLSYRPPSKNLVAEILEYRSKLQNIVDKIKKEKPSLIVLTGDFNARSPLFWADEQDETAAGKNLSDFMLLNCFEQLINEPTHFPRDEIETCIDLILTDKPNALVHSGVIPSPDPRCKHHIINGTINFSVPSPPPYKRKIWKYDRANIPLIKQSLGDVDWVDLFNGADIDEMVSVFTDKILNVMSTYIPNKVVTFNDKDAPWVTPEVKTAIKRIHRVYAKWKERGKPIEGRENVKLIQNLTDKAIHDAKKRYLDDLSEKLSNPKSGTNIFWSAFKRIINSKKLTNIPPLIENSVFITCFQEKAKILNEYFALQCTPLQYNSVLPELTYKTDHFLNNVAISEDAISKIISKLNANKAHGVDNISIAMLKLCNEEVLLPLKLIFQKCLSGGKFPSSWKKANVQPVHKKESRQSKKNYRPISLLPICSKIFEKILFDAMYAFLNENRLLSKHQSGFRPGDSTINQLLSITNDIF